MIKEGSMLVLTTENAVFSPCEVVGVGKTGVTITYYAGSKRDRKTGKFNEVRPIVTIPFKDITKVSERH